MINDLNLTETLVCNKIIEEATKLYTNIPIEAAALDCGFHHLVLFLSHFSFQLFLLRLSKYEKV